MVYRKDIQAFRAIAILLVIAAHFQLPGLSAGFIGVDIFFVISGYVITRLIDVEINANEKFNYLNFYVRRFNRLAPALLVMLITVLIVNYFINEPYGQLLQLPKAMAAVFWASNLQLAFEKIDYFDSDVENNLFLHTWSLGVEEQFYLVWPAMLVVIFRLSFIKRHIFIVSVFSASFILCLWFSSNIAAYAYYLMPMRIWQFLMGGLVFLAFEKYVLLSFSKPLLKCIHSGGILLLGFSIYWVDVSNNYPGLQAIFPTLAAALLLINGGQESSKIYSSSILQWLGDRSYSLYLWHWPFWCFIKSFPIQDNVRLLLALILTLLTASFSYKYIESPFRHVISLKWSSTKNIIFHSASVAVCVFFISFLFTKAETGLINFNVEQSGSIGRYMADLPSLYKKGCDTDILKDDVLRCPSGSQEAKSKVILFGDSIGAQWLPAIEKIYAEQKAIVSYTKSACTLADKPIFYNKIGRLYDECERWRKKAIGSIVQESPDIIFMGSGIVNLSHKDWIEGLASTIDSLSATNAKIYLLRPTPVLSSNPMQCLKREIWVSQFFAVNGLCDHISEVDAGANDQVYASLLEVKKRYKNVYILDMNDLICDQDACPLKVDDLVSYRDQRHLTASFAAYLSSKMHERVSQQQ